MPNEAVGNTNNTIQSMQFPRDRIESASSYLSMNLDRYLLDIDKNDRKFFHWLDFNFHQAFREQICFLLMEDKSYKVDKKIKLRWNAVRQVVVGITGA